MHQSESPWELDAAAAQSDVSPALVRAVAWQELRFHPEATSSAGAVGVMQLMPGTARLLGVDPHDLHQNIQGGARYLQLLMNRFGGDLSLALAAYNAGPGAVARYGRGSALPGDPAVCLRDPGSVGNGRFPERQRRGLAMRKAWGVPAVALASMSFVAPAAAEGFDPPGSNVILNAVDWLQGTLLGNVATAVAVIAVASVGYMMLTGRMNWRATAPA